MKRVRLGIVAAALLVALAGCASATVEHAGKAEKEKSMFVVVETTVEWKIVYHRENKVMYAVSCGTYNHGTFTVLVNPDGTPMLYGGGAE